MVIFRPEWFQAYGLDINKNCLEAPICDCGCGGKGNILLSAEQDLYDFAVSVLMEIECQHCSIFAHYMNGKMYAFLKIATEDDDPLIILHIDNTNMNFFHNLDEKFNFHCIGLLVETRNGEWKIVED